MSDEAPEFLTIEEAMRVVRLGRSRAYEEARLYERTGGAEGLIPVKRAGRLFRVPRALLEQVAGGPIQVRPADAAPEPPVDEATTAPEPTPSEAPPAEPTPVRRRPSRPSTSDAPQLFAID
ncbi:MAG TPA: hypothetical protein VGA13_05155 [Acidimicrobiales bacterium]|jgi:hypothetical protein